MRVTGDVAFGVTAKEARAVEILDVPLHRVIASENPKADFESQSSDL